MREPACMNLASFMLTLRIFSGFTACFFSANTISAQPCFERSYGGFLNEEATLVRPTFDKGYILIGTRDDTVFHTRAYYVLKLDSLGNEIWSKSYGDQFNQMGSSIVQTLDSNYAFVGSHQAAAYSAVAEVVRIDQNGTLINSKTYPPFDGWSTQGIGIVASSDSTLAISSYTDGFISQNYYSLIKLNQDLSIRWSNFVSFDGSVMNEHDASQGTYNRFFTLGHYANFYYSTPPLLNVTEVRHIDSNGALLLDTLYLWNSVSNSIAATREGGMIVCGDRDTLGNRNIALSLLDSSGALIWQKELGSSKNESTRHARQTKDGGFAILGSVPHQYFPSLNDIFLTKVNAQGDSMWTRYFGATFDDVALHMQETHDGGFIILGKTNSFEESHIYLIKTDSLGIISSPYRIKGPGHYFCKGDTVSLMLDPMPDSGSSVLWSSGETTDSISVCVNGNYSATITDSSGNVFQTPNYFLFFANTADARLSAADTLEICAGNRLENLVPSSLSFTYTWYLNDTIIGDAATNFIIPSQTGKYTLQVSNYCGSDADTVILDSLFELPDKPLLNFSGNKFICVGDSLQLFTPDSGLSYQWWYALTGPPLPVAGAVDTAFMARSEGVYLVQATDIHQCTEYSNPLNIFIDNYAAYVNTSGPLSFCQGGHVILSAPAGSEYVWNTGDTLNSIFVNTNGNYWYSMKSMFGCYKQSDTVHTEVYLKPYVNLGPDTIICNTGNYLIDAGPGYSSYLWQDGSSNQAYLAFSTSPGNDSSVYFVDVTDVNACSNRDSVIVYFEVCQAISESKSSAEPVFINSLISRDGDFSIRNESTETLSISFWNAMGSLVHRQSLFTGNTRIPHRLFSEGIYFYAVFERNRYLSVGKVVVQ